MTLVHEELTGRILETCFEVSNELGAGFLESVYQKALLIALHQKGLQARPQFPIGVLFRGIEVGLLVNFGRPRIEFHRLRKPTSEQSQ